ncbi:hypothetical protein HFO92_17890 [Rhizobium leguminosarum]|nr:hypothetical protein [Rhizobium leguminosarum]
MSDFLLSPVSAARGNRLQGSARAGRRRPPPDHDEGGWSDPAPMRMMHVLRNSIMIG